MPHLSHHRQACLLVSLRGVIATVLVVYLETPVIEHHGCNEDELRVLLSALLAATQGLPEYMFIEPKVIILALILESKIPKLK